MTRAPDGSPAGNPVDGPDPAGDEPPPGPGLPDAAYARLLGLRTGLRRFQRWSEDQARDAGLTPAQHQLLLAIRGHLDLRGPTIGDIAAALLLRHHSAVELVDRADAAGLLVRRRDADDHRLVRLSLTAEGQSRLQALSEAHLQELLRLGPSMAALWEGLDHEGHTRPAPPARPEAPARAGLPVLSEPQPQALPPRPGYLLRNDLGAAGERMAALAEVFDGWTFAHLARVGVGPGWRCWEVGAGGPSVTRWLAARAGETGRVVATDIDVTWLADLTEPNVTVLRHDVGTEPPPAGELDLVHARLVLVHLPDREAALRTMLGALRPGGWLVIEDADPQLQPLSCLDPVSPAEELANRLRGAFRTLLAERGADLAFGRTLARRLDDAGLTDVQADAYLPVSIAACAALEATTIAMVRDQLVERDMAAADEIDQHLANVSAGRLALAQPPLVTAWGRRPAAPVRPARRHG